MEKTGSKNIYVDDSAISFVAYQVVLVTIFGLHFQQQWLLFLVVLDFLIRTTGLFVSPLYYIARKLSVFLHFEERPVFAAPKRFAASLGALLSLLIAINYDDALGIYLGIFLILLASLESVFRICIGCYIYNFLVIPIIRTVNHSKN